MRVFVALLLVIFAVRACAENPGESPLLRIEEGRVFRTVNGEPIHGSEVLDVLVEESWNKYLNSFIEYAIRKEAIEKAKIVVSAEEIEVELRRVLKTKAGGLGGDPDEIQRRFGGGVVDALRRAVSSDLGLLKIFVRDKKLPAETTTDNPRFIQMKKQFLEHQIELQGIVTDPKELGTGEALRIGPHPYPRDEVRRFILEAEGQIPKDELMNILEQLALEKLVEAEALRRSVTLADDDRSFHFSYLARLKEQETGVPGRAVMMQVIQAHGMKPEQYLRSRIFTWDALITLMVKQHIKLKELRAEFALNPDKYRMQENLTAHIFVQVLDPDGHPYGPQWQAEGHPAVNAFVESRREAQFAAAKSKIEGLLPLAKANFDDTARQYSDDASKKAAGLIGRLGHLTIPMRPIDKNVVEAALKLKPGEISEPVRSDYGWHILKCLEKQDVTFEEVDERIYMNLIHKHRTELIETLMKGAKIEDKF